LHSRQKKPVATLGTCGQLRLGGKNKAQGVWLKSTSDIVDRKLESTTELPLKATYTMKIQPTNRVVMETTYEKHLL
jgi:hypothetical protein